MAKNTFTIEIGEKRIKLVDSLSTSSASISANSIAMTDLPVNIYNSDEKTSRQIIPFVQKIITDSKIEKKEVDVIIPNNYSFSRVIEMPILTEKELISAIKYQADQFIPVPIANVNLDIEILSQNKNKYLILLIAAQNSILEKVSNIVESAGLIPNSIETETSAMLNLISLLDLNKQFQGKLKYSLFINIGFSSTTLVLVDILNKIPLEIYDFALGETIFIKDLVANYSLSEPQAKNLLLTYNFNNPSSQYVNLNSIFNTPYNEMISEIERFIVSIKNKYSLSVDSAFLFGDGSKINSLDKKVTDSTGIKTLNFNLGQYLSKNNVTDFFKNDLDFFIPAFGSSLR